MSIAVVSIFAIDVRKIDIRKQLGRTRPFYTNIIQTVKVFIDFTGNGVFRAGYDRFKR